jgi:hypothetical protein
VKSDREENNSQRKSQGLASAPAMRGSGKKGNASSHQGEKKKVAPEKLSHSVTAGQRK